MKIDPLLGYLKEFHQKGKDSNAKSYFITEELLKCIIERIDFSNEMLARYEAVLGHMQLFAALNKLPSKN